MNCLRWYGCSAHLVNCAFDQTQCAADQFINFAAFDELRNIWSIAQRTCNSWFTWLGLRLGLELGLRLGLGIVLEFSQTRTLTKCALPARFLFSNFTEDLQLEEKREYIEIWSNVGLHVERSIWITTLLYF